MKHNKTRNGIKQDADKCGTFETKLYTCGKWNGNGMFKKKYCTCSTTVSHFEGCAFSVEPRCVHFFLNYGISWNWMKNYFWNKIENIAI